MAEWPSGRVVVVALIGAACSSSDKGGDDTGMCDPTDVCAGSEIVPDTAVAGFGCRADFEYDPRCHDNIEGVRVIGSTDSPAEDPETIRVRLPEECAPAGFPTRPYDDLDTSVVGDDWIAAGSDHSQCDVGEDATLACNSYFQAQADTWEVFLPPHPSGDCTQYGDITLHFLETSGPDCAGNGTTTTSLACTAANDVEIDLYHRHVRDLGGDAYEHSRLLPLVVSGGDLTERAWLRSIEVVDWGDASELFVVPYGEHLRLVNGDYVDASSMVKLDLTNDSDTFSVGQVHMGATFVIDSIPPGPSFEPPHIRVDWTCEYNPSNPHFDVANVASAYASRLSDLSTLGLTQDHRVILRGYPGPSVVTIELQGRHRDRIVVPVTLSGGALHFDYQSDMYGGIDVEGEINMVSGDLLVEFDTFAVSGFNLGTPTLTFEPYAE